jgi:putative tricarboxylic transport membrane protein
LRTLLASALLAVLALSAAPGGAAPAFPDRAVEIIAPAGPGGGFDLISRMTARALQEEKLIGVPVTVTNMPGGSGVVALAHVITRLKGNAYTLVAVSPATTLQIANRATPYTYRDVTPVASLITDYGVLVVRKDSTIKDLRTLIQVLKQNPGVVTVAGGSAPGSMDHAIFAKAAKAGGIDALKVAYLPFQGGGEAMAALLGRSASVLSTGASEVLGQLEAGTIRVLAVLAPQRLGGIFSAVPTAKEQGFDTTFAIWRGFYAPPDIPPSALRSWEDLLTRMSRTPAWAKVLNETKWFPFVLAGDRFRTFILDDTRNFETLLKDLGFLK